MEAIEVEMKVQRILDDLVAGHAVEDSRVEIKREWIPDHSKAARRLAGLCNAARSPWVLWLVGVDEQGEFSPAASTQTNEWLAQVLKHFEGVAPKLLQDLKIPYKGHQV